MLIKWPSIYKIVHTQLVCSTLDDKQPISEVTRSPLSSQLNAVKNLSMLCNVLGHCIASKLARKFTCIFLWPYWTWRKPMALLTVKRGGSNSDKEIAQRVDGKSSVEEREPDGYWAKTWTLSWGVATLPTAIQSCSMPTSSSSSSSSWTSPTTNNSEIIKISMITATENVFERTATIWWEDDNQV